MKNAIVTGASTGIGLELTRELLRRGYRVATLARRPEVLAAAAADVDPSGERVLQCAMKRRFAPRLKARCSNGERSTSPSRTPGSAWRRWPSNSARKSASS